MRDTSLFQELEHPLRIASSYSLGVLIGCDVRLLWLDADPGRLLAAEKMRYLRAAHASRSNGALRPRRHLLALEIEAYPGERPKPAPPPPLTDGRSWVSIETAPEPPPEFERIVRMVMHSCSDSMSTNSLTRSFIRIACASSPRSTCHTAFRCTCAAAHAIRQPHAQPFAREPSFRSAAARFVAARTNTSHHDEI